MPKLADKKIIIIVVLLLATVAALLSLQLLASSDSGTSVAVLTAAQDIPANVVITEEMLVVKEIPEDYVPDQALHSMEEAVGKTSKVQILKGEQLLAGKVASREQAESRFSYRLADNQRAVTVAVSEITGVAGLLTVGDRVDAIWTRESKGITYTSTLVQNKEILATGSITTTQEDGKQHIVPTITLSVSPAEANLLTLAENVGSLKFTLRPPTDKEVHNLQTLTFKE